ncbi:hypothetical protein C8F01DRAFT_1363465 [Mycena amicta]|nr:hypothetical protein C8F01DRAFT_1363465 [Mycena amicta]
MIQASTSCSQLQEDHVRVHQRHSSHLRPTIMSDSDSAHDPKPHRQATDSDGTNTTTNMGQAMESLGLRPEDIEAHPPPPPNTKPSAGDKVIGEVEKLAGAVAMNPNTMAKGQERKQGGFKGLPADSDSESPQK